LLEVLVTTLIMSIIMGALFVVLSIGQRSWFSGDATIELRDQTVKALATMDREISATGTGRINLAIGESSPFLTFWLPDASGDGVVIDAGGSIEWTGPITYSVNASSQVIRSFLGTDTVLGNDITALLFTRTENRLMQVDVTAQKESAAGQQIQDVEQAVIKIRN